MRIDAGRRCFTQVRDVFEPLDLDCFLELPNANKGAILFVPSPKTVLAVSLTKKAVRLMLAYELEDILLDELDYAGGKGLLRGHEIPWPNGRVLPDISTALFLGEHPIAYLSRFTELDQDKIQELHRNVWSQSKAPLLFVLLPHEIRIYNGYEPTPRPGEELDTQARLLQKLSGLTDHLVARREIRTQLAEATHYDRVYLETGAFWDTPEGRRINYQSRADQQLIEGMKQMRLLLTQAGLSNHVAYTLLGRSVFIRYLEDRGVLSARWIRQLTDGGADSYLHALEDRSVTYLLYERLSKRFNGDLFPIEPEEHVVNSEHLELLHSFLNRTNLATGQLSFWPFNFEFIPIELISNIYDIFLEDHRATGAYYTPLLLADFILEETMGMEEIHPEMTVLDPACGSGVFLVGAFRRLVQAWRDRHGEPTAMELSRLLRASIFGVDSKPEAVRIAAFSLYLELLNHLGNNTILEDTFQFPRLFDTNLLDCDFFNPTVDIHFADRSFDRIVGNLPWGRGTLTHLAKQWLRHNGLAVGGKQPAPAFILRAPRFCKEDGEIAMLAPVKGTMLVASDTHREFRAKFLNSYHVRAVVNFASLRHELFLKSISPTLAVFYAPISPSPGSKLIYGVPKPSALSQHLKAIILATTEIKFLDRQELITNPHLWKVAMWGNSRDAALIERLASLPNLREQAHRFGLSIGEGIQINGGDENPAPWLEGLSLVPTDKLRPYFLDMSVCKPIEAKVFHRPRTPNLFKAPLALIRQSECKAAFSEVDLAFSHTITGVAGTAGEEWLLKWLVAYVNSSLVKYYQFLTSTRWAVERGNIIQLEYELMPFVVPDRDDPRLIKIVQHLDSIQKLLDRKKSDILFDPVLDMHIQEHIEAVDSLVFDLYELHPTEQQLVNDMLQYGVEFFEWSQRQNRTHQGSIAVMRPDLEQLSDYAEVFARTVSSLLSAKGTGLRPRLYSNGAPLTVVCFDFVNIDEIGPAEVVTSSDAMRMKLRELDALIANQMTPSMFLRRHVRIYDGNQVSLVRPSEQRFWTQSQARADADAFIAELLS